MSDEGEIEQLTAVFRQLGAEDSQAETMARQLSKRADQIALSEGIDRVAALKRLLEMVRRGRAGESYEGP